jgi:hypothetical protein
MGAFRTSPDESLYVESKQPSLENSHIKLSMQSITTLKACPSNPAYDFFNHLNEYEYSKQPNTIQSFVLRRQSHFNNSDLYLDMT